MFEYRESNDNYVFENQALRDFEFPEPLENWSLEDFEELVPRAWI